jgi:hypothetical protein
MKKQGFAETLASKDYYVGCYDELEIEEGLYRLRKSGDRSGLESAEAEAMRAALREIDRLKISGDYEVERVLLRKRYESKPRLKDWKLDSAFSKYWENFRAGMKSPDLDQRARFLAFYDAAELGRMLPTEIVDLIAVLAVRVSACPGATLRGRSMKCAHSWRVERVFQALRAKWLQSRQRHKRRTAQNGMKNSSGIGSGSGNKTSAVLLSWRKSHKHLT